jgi:glutathione peroxidase
MFTRAAALVLCALGCAVVAYAAQPGGKPSLGQPPSDDPSYVLGFKMKTIDGKKDLDLSEYKGKVILMVNVASKCGYTPQYDALEKLYESKKDKGLVVLGFPANNFGGQEPGSNDEISKFCTDKYHVTFPMFEKISVKGPDQHALYKKLAGQPEPIGGDPKWNFTKFVVDRSGHVVARFDAKNRTGLEPELLKKIDDMLGDTKKDEPKDEAKPKTKSAS